MRRTFNPVHEQWQRTACNLTGLQFVSRCDLEGGGPSVPLTRPHRVRHILGDGNCLFRSLSYIITGTEAQHLQVREALLNHLVSIEDMMIGHHISGEYSSVVEYIRGANMDRNGTWGTDIELITASHMLNTSLSMYDTVVLGVHMGPTTLIGHSVPMSQKCPRISDTHLIILMLYVL